LFRTHASGYGNAFLAHGTTADIANEIGVDLGALAGITLSFSRSQYSPIDSAVNNNIVEVKVDLRRCQHRVPPRVEAYEVVPIVDRSSYVDLRMRVSQRSGTLHSPL
jgi:hypothetical protein